MTMERRKMYARRHLLLVFAVATICYFVLNRNMDLDTWSVTQSWAAPKFGDKRLCTHALFRKYYQQYHHFPSEGYWQNINGTEFYQSEICMFSKPNISVADLKTCLLKGNVTSVMTMGDSNGMQMYSSLLDLVRAASATCGKLRYEAFKTRVPDIHYLNRSGKDWTKHISVSYRHCIACGGRQINCNITKDTSTHSVNVEHMGLTQIIDTSIQIHVADGFDGQRYQEDFWAPTTSEFLLKYFIEDRYPDILIIFFPFNHVKVLHVDKVVADISYFKMLLEIYVPKTTKIFFMPGFAEFEEARKKAKFYYNRRYENRLATDQIDEMNHKLYEILEKELIVPNGRVYGFIDSLEASRSRGNWSTDSIHMIKPWYRSIISMFWDLYCNSLILDEF